MEFCAAVKRQPYRYKCIKISKITSLGTMEVQMESKVENTGRNKRSFACIRTERIWRGARRGR